MQVFPDVEYCLMREKFRDIVTRADRFEWVDEAKVTLPGTAAALLLLLTHAAQQFW